MDQGREEGELGGRVAVVTGGAYGIGQAAAIALAEEGARVVVADVSAPGGEETVSRIRRAGGDAVFVRADVSQPAEVELLFKRSAEIYGRLDYAFNNAGIEGESAPTGDYSLQGWNRVLEIDLRGVWLCMRYELPLMLEQGGGSIVNNASVAGLGGFSGLCAYTAAKHGVVGLTRAAALEYAPAGIRINAVCPGVIHTAMIDRTTGQDPELEQQYARMQPLGRMGEPGDVARAVVWLCSGAASFVTGTVLTIDGGLTAGPRRER